MPALLTFGEILFDELPDGPRAGGGPFNAAAHLVALGHRAAIVSAVGDDARGRALRAVAGELGVGDGLLQTSYLETGRVTVAFDAAGEPDYDIVAPVAWDLIRWPGDGPRGAGGREVAIDPATAALPAAAAEAPAVLYWLLGIRSAVSRATLERVLATAGPSALRVVDVGLRQNFYDAASLAWVLRAATVAKLNEAELATVCRLLDVPPSASALARAFDLETVVVTRGADGARSFRSGQVQDAPAPRIARVVDTIGCGDAALAGYVAARLAGHPEAQCLAELNARGSDTATRAGGLPPHRDEAYRRLRE